MKKNIFAQLVCKTGVALLILALFCTSCNKDGQVQAVTTATVLDSIIRDSASIHFIYDGLGRVIEDRYQVADTLQERNTYEYSGSDSVPFKKKYFIRLNTVPDAVSVFQYNGNKQKIYDSTYYSGGYVITTLDYYASNRIAVLLRSFYGGYYNSASADTIYLSNTGKFDSLRAYTTYFGTPGIWTYWYTDKFTGYDPHANIFASLSIASCNFYPCSIWFQSASRHMPSVFYPVIEFFNPSYFTTITTNYSFAGTNSTQRQFLFNSDNLPASVKVIDTYNSSSNFADYRFVYK